MLRALPIALALIVAAAPAHADRLLIDRVSAQSGVSLPERGQSMAAVEAKFGAPTQKLDSRGGQRSAWPEIQRWRYETFTVYFERGRVINAVLNRAAPTEAGPAPAQR